MKKLLTLLAVLLFTFTLSSQTREFVVVEDHEAYCEDLAMRGIEIEWERKYITTFREYHDSYWDWYNNCMEDVAGPQSGPN